MEQHKRLYKGTSSMLSPRNHKRETRELHMANRAKRREDLYTTVRNITSSPSPKIVSPVERTANAHDGDKENNAANIDTANTGHCPAEATKAPPAYTSRLAQAVCKTPGSKLSRQEAYLMRFASWKMDRRPDNQKKAAPLKKPPFISTGGPTTQGVPVKSTTSLFAPPGHQFRPPAGLKQPMAQKMPAASAPTAIERAKRKHRKSIYSVVDTPMKNTSKAVRSKNNPILGKTTNARSAVATSTPAAAVKSKHVVVVTRSANGLSSTHMDKSLLSANQSKPLLPLTRPLFAQTRPALIAAITSKTTAKCAKKPSEPLVRPKVAPKPPTEKTKPSTFKVPSATRPLPRPAPTTQTARRPAVGAVGKPERVAGGGGAAGKAARSLLAGREEAKEKKTTRLGTNMKAKRVPIALKMTGQAMASAAVSAFAETPTECSNTNQFQAFVTSTQMKAGSSLGAADSAVQLSNLADTISPVEPLNNTAAAESKVSRRSAAASGTSSAHRALLQDGASGAKGRRQFNFVRYAERDSTIFDSSAIGLDKQTPQQQNSIMRSAHSKTNKQTELEKSAGGKESLTTAAVENQDVAVPATASMLQPTAEEQPIEVLRTLEAVRYFRTQLADEIARLHALCDRWDAYRVENKQRLEETDGNDQILATVGQTRLLTSKKFKQFEGLIDRCEQGAKGMAPADDGSEKTKLITAIDLEGFWSMLGLQVDDVGERFARLERWKANDWIDPDAVKPKIRKRLSGRVTKQKAKAKGAVVKGGKPANSGLKQMMRQMHANMMKEKMAAGGEANTSATISQLGTPSRRRSRHQSFTGSPNAQGRVAVLVLDRKSYSQAATVVSIPTSAKRSSMSPQLPRRDSSQTTPQLSLSIRRMQRSLSKLQETIETGGGSDLRRSTLLAASKQRYLTPAGVEATPSSPTTPPPTETPSFNGARRSILKTPGTAKGKPRSVVFSEKLRVKRFQFTVNEEADGACNGETLEEMNSNLKNLSGSKGRKTIAHSNEDGDSPRMYKLRTRQVTLRPDCEIIIPCKNT